jgi:virulence factor Mce-like protein
MGASNLARVLKAAAIAAAFVAVVVAGTASQRVLLTPTTYVLKVVAQDAAGLYPGSDVMIAGARAGSVQDISLTSDGLALITTDLDPTYAPVHQDASVSIRPKSLLGEMYVALEPGQGAATLPSGATLPRLQVNRSTDLQQVVSTFDQPTRDKLQTVIVELGGGVTGRGQELNSAIPYGRQDLSDLAAVADTLAQHDQELKAVIQDLNTVLGELATSDRSQQLSLLIQNTEKLFQNLVQQEAQLKEMLATTNAALSRLKTSLNGTAPALNGIANELPVTVDQGNLLLANLGSNTDAVLPNLDTMIQGIQRGPVVFGGRDANGYATRISLVVGCSSIDLCPTLTGPLSQLPLARSLPVVGTPVGGQAPPAGGPAAGTTDQALLKDGILGFLLGGSGR